MTVTTKDNSDRSLVELDFIKLMISNMNMRSQTILKVLGKIEELKNEVSK